MRQGLYERKYTHATPQKKVKVARLTLEHSYWIFTEQYRQKKSTGAEMLVSTPLTSIISNSPPMTNAGRTIEVSV